MRLIDADAYSAEMKKRQDACMEAMEIASYDGEQFSPKEHWDGVFAAFVEAKLTLDDMPTIGGWISVKERMPEVDKSILYCAFGSSVGEGVYRGFDGRHHVWNMYAVMWNMYAVSGTHWDNEVTHWMPLPEKPEEVDK